MRELRVGFAICGSYCTFKDILTALETIKLKYGDVTPILSENAASTDSRFGTSEEFIAKVEAICERPVIKTIRGVEPIGPKALFDILVIAPCTGNTIAKLAAGITDSSVTMAAKAHLRNMRPLLIAVSTNDGLSGNAANIGEMMNRKNVYFVPFYQDDPKKKPNSLVADFEKITEAIDITLEGVQMQPMLLENKT